MKKVSKNKLISLKIFQIFVYPQNINYCYKLNKNVSMQITYFWFVKKTKQNRTLYLLLSLFIHPISFPSGNTTLEKRGKLYFQ